MGLFRKKEPDDHVSRNSDPVRRIKKAILSVRQNHNSSTEKELRDSIYECFASGKWVPMITLGTMGEMHRLDVRSVKEGGVIAWYTSPEEIKKPRYDILMTDINKLLGPIYSNREIIGMIINPETDSLVIRKGYLLAILLHSQYESQKIAPDPPRKWGPGIPKYSPSDLMTKAEFTNFAMETVFAPLKEEFDIISATDNVDAIVNIVAQKDNQLCLIAVRGGCAEEFQALSPEERETLQEYKKKYHAKCFLAAVEYRSATDMERFEKCLALKGDGFYAKYTGLDEL